MKHRPTHLSVRAPLVESLEARRLLAAGDLAASFAGNGLLRFDLDAGRAVQVLEAGDEVGGGDLVLGGYSDVEGGGDRRDYLVRLNADGSFDSAFGAGGILALGSGGEGTGVYQVLGLGDGDALVVRANGNGSTVTRYNPDGTPDAAFATGGTLVISDVRARLAPLGGGFVAVGSSEDGTLAPVRVYAADGSPRATNFETDLVADAGVGNLVVADVAVDGAGRIYVAGDVADAVDPRAGIFRLNGDLSLDDAYGAGGEARLGFAPEDQFATRTLRIDPQDRAVLDVNEDDGLNRLARFTTNGLPEKDAPFRYEVGGPFNPVNEAVGAVPLGDARVLVGGYFEQTSGGVDSGDAGFARLNADFSADAGFGSDNLGAGQRRYNLGNVDDQIAGFILTSDGGAVAFGRTAQLSPSLDFDAVVFKIDLDAPAPPPTPPPAPDLATLDDAGTLSVVGTDASEILSVATEGREVVVTRTPASGSPVVQRFDRVGDVLRVVIDAKAGNDGVNYALLAPSTILGGTGDDTLTGGGGRDVLSGGGGNDSLIGGDNDDSLIGGDGDDRFDGGAGDDTLTGDNGDDIFLAEPGADRYVGGAGNDSLSYAGRSDGVSVTAGSDADDGGDNERDFVSGDIETLVGGSGDDSLTAASGTRRIDGGTGNDTITDAAGNQTYNGGDGNDRFVKVAGSDTMLGGDGNDTFAAAAANDGTDLFDGGAGANTVDYSARTTAVRIVGSTGGDAGGEGDVYVGIQTYVGGTFNDTLGGPGLNGGQPVTLNGGAGDDTLLGRDADDLLRGGDGNDVADFAAATAGMRVSFDGSGGTVRIGDDVETVLGGSGNDTLDGGAATEAVTLMGGGGDDVITGGAFADVLMGGDGADTLDGGDGDDRLYGQDGDDVMTGGDGADSLRGGAGADRLDGGDGNDRIVPGRSGGEGDTVIGGDGFDLVDYRESSQSVNLTRGSLDNPRGGPAVADDVELAFGGAGDDTLNGFIVSRGGDGDDTILLDGTDDAAAFGEAGDDRIDAAVVGRTHLDGGAGDDTLRGGALGDDTYVLGDGRDEIFDAGLPSDGDVNTLLFTAAPAAVTVDLADPADPLPQDSPLGSISGTFRDVLGSPFSDAITGSDAGNYLSGGGGDDTLLGLDGKDVLVGGDGTDSLDGGDDFDFLYAFTERDGDDGFANTLFGGRGFDVAFGAADDLPDDIQRMLTSREALDSLLG